MGPPADPSAPTHHPDLPPSWTPRDTRRILADRFRLDRFRPGQAEVVEAVLAGRDVLAMLPTGAGKSLCYQLPSLCLSGTTLVISPLTALIRDQLARLHRLGIEGAYALSGLTPPGAARQALEALAAGRARCLLIAPERIPSPPFQRALSGARVSLFVVDEAHCLDQWGDEFRPDYLRLGALCRALQPGSILALTATATPAARARILSALGMRRPRILAAPLDRPNLQLQVRRLPQEERLQALLQALAPPEARPALVYVGRRADTLRLARRLAGAGRLGEAYHAGLDPARRLAIQDRYQTGRTDLMIATSAFGMGIDKPDIRTVLHWQPPPSLEAYYQEAGRAGRDGLPSRCLMLHDRGDLCLLRRQLEARYPTLGELRRVAAALRARGPGGIEALLPRLDPQALARVLRAFLGEPPSLERAWAELGRSRGGDLARLEAMSGYLGALTCRRRKLLAWFGERAPWWCGRCDRCGWGERLRPWLDRLREARGRLYEAMGRRRGPAPTRSGSGRRGP